VRIDGYDTKYKGSDLTRAAAADIPVFLARLCRVRRHSGSGGAAVRAAADDRLVRRVCRADLRMRGRARLAFHRRVPVWPACFGDRRRRRELDLYIPLYAAQFYHFRLSADLPCHAGRLRRGRHADHPDQAAGKAPCGSGKRKNARQSPAGRLSRYPYAPDRHRRRHRRDSGKRQSDLTGNQQRSAGKYARRIQLAHRRGGKSAVRHAYVRRFEYQKGAGGGRRGSRRSLHEIQAALSRGRGQHHRARYAAYDPDGYHSH